MECSRFSTRVPVVAQWVKSPVLPREDKGLIPGLAQCVKNLALQ